MVSHATEVTPRRNRRRIAGCEEYRNLEAGVRARLIQVAGDMSIAGFADAIKLNHESVRRAIRGHTITLELLTRVCVRFGVSAEWLLFGITPREAPARPFPSLPYLVGVDAVSGVTGLEPVGGESEDRALSVGV